MHLHEAIKKVFKQVDDLLEQLTCDQYIQQNGVLVNASIGQHVRHIIELFIELEKGYEISLVNYDQRKRDHRIETDRVFAKQVLWDLSALLNRKDKPLMLEMNYGEAAQDVISIASNYHRELMYNLEHTIHHLAIIRIAVNHLPSVKVPENFGIASATINHRNICAQ